MARKILNRIHQSDQHNLVVSSHILSEIADVLSRPRMQARCPLSADDIQRYCQFLAAAAEEVSILPLAPVIADPQDQAVIEAAVAARVNAICTGDVHFEAEPVREYLAQFGIVTMTDHQPLTLLA